MKCNNQKRWYAAFSHYCRLPKHSYHFKCVFYKVRSSLTTWTRTSRRTEHTSTSHTLAFYVSPWPTIQPLPDYQHSSQTSPAFTWHMTVFTTECTNKLTGTVTRHKLSLFTSAHQHTQHTQCGLGEMLWQPLLTPHSRVFSWPTLRVTTRVHKQPSSLGQVIVYRLPQTTHHRASTNTQHTSLTTLERRYDPFVIHDSTNRKTTWPGYSPRVSQPMDDSTLHLEIIFQVPSNRRQHTVSIPGAVFDPRSKQSTTADNPRLPSNRREHKVFAFQAIDDSTKSSSSKQSTTADNPRLPGNRRHESTKSLSSKQSTSVPQPTHWRADTTTLAKKIETGTRQRAQVRDLSSMHAPVVDVRACFNFFGQGSSTRERQLAASTADHALTNHTHWLSQCTLVRSHCTHARATHSHTNTNYKKTVCQCHERIHCLCSMETKKKKKEIEREKRNTHSPYKHKLHETRKRRPTSVTSELKKKNTWCACRSNVSVYN